MWVLRKWFTYEAFEGGEDDVTEGRKFKCSLSYKVKAKASLGYNVKPRSAWAT